jgi:hypothetical protein
MHWQASDQQGCTAALPTTLGGTYCFFIASVSFLQSHDQSVCSTGRYWLPG